MKSRERLKLPIGVVFVFPRQSVILVEIAVLVVGIMHLLQ